MEIERSKFFAKKNLTRSIILLVVCTPLLVTSFLKLIYYIPKSGNQITDAMAKGVGDLVTKIYHGFEPVQWLWPVSPTPSFESVFTTGNIITFFLFIGFLWGIASFQLGMETIDDLSKAKQKARKNRLENEYRHRT